MGLQFSAGWTGSPEHSLDAQRRRKQVAQDGRPGGVSRKEGMELGRLPVGDARQDDAVHIGEKTVKVLALRGRSCRQFQANLAGLRLGQNRQSFDALVIVCNPVHYLLTVAAELSGGHMVLVFVRHTFFLDSSRTADRLLIPRYKPVGSHARHAPRGTPPAKEFSQQVG